MLTLTAVGPSLFPFPRLGTDRRSVSPYSYFAVHYLLKNRSALTSHGVDVEYVCTPRSFFC